MKKTPPKIRDLSEVMADLERAQKTAAKTLGEFPEGMRSGHEASKRQAQEKLPALREELAALTVPGRLVGAFITAPADVAQQIGQLVNDGGVVIRADEFLGTVLGLVEKSMGKDRVFGVAQYSLMNHAVRSTAIELGVFSWEAPPFKRAVCKTPADTKKLLADTLIKYLGPNFELMFFKKKIVDKLVADGNVGALVPVVIFGQEQHQAYLSQLFARTRTHELDETFKATEASVQALFKKEVAAKPKTKKDAEIPKDTPPEPALETETNEQETNNE